MQRPTIPQKSPPISKFKCDIPLHLRYRIVTPATERRKGRLAAVVINGTISHRISLHFKHQREPIEKLKIISAQHNF